MEITKEVVEEFINSNADYQEELKGKYTVEKEIVKEKEYTDEELEGLLAGKQSINDKLYEKARKKVYSKLLGKEELTEDDYKTEFVTKNALSSLETELKETVIKSAIGEENFLKAKDFFDFGKIKKSDKGWEGIDNLKALFPQQQVKPIITPNASTPPAGKTAEQIKKEESDAYLKKLGFNK